jgi:hypothetical protein
MKAEWGTEIAAKSNLFYIESYGVQIGIEIGEGIRRSMIKKHLRFILANGYTEIKNASPTA